MLLKQVQRNQRDFRATILRRDVIEVGIGLLLLPYWIYQGLTQSLPWTWWLGVPAIVFVVGYFLVDRMRHPQTPSDPSEPLVSCVKNSLTQVEHQIWLLRNIFWWYLLPFTLAILAFFAHVAWLSSRNWLDALSHAGNFVFLFALYGFIYYLNQRAVRTDLEPRRQELLTLLASLGDELTDEPASGASTKSAKRPGKLWRFLIGFALCVLAIVLPALIDGIADSSYDEPPQSSGPAGDSLASLVTNLRNERNLVGLAAMVMVDGQIEAAAAQGERKIGSGVPVEIGDRWHLGGITKSITATMIARLIEAGQMKWTDTVGEIFPDAAVHGDWKPVTLRQLLTDTAGAPPNFPVEIWHQRPALGAERTRARREAVLNVLAEKPAYPPGTKYTYSNVGYTIVGAMAEKVTGATWEDLIQREVFEPLQLTESGFGPPQSADETLQQPRGHRSVLIGKVPVDDTSDNSPIMGPSGMIHMTLRDLCIFANEHLLGELGEGKLLSTESYKLLHTPELAQHACGWLKIEPAAQGQPAMYWHNGSNTMWYALVVFIPDKKTVVAVTSNDGDIDNAQAAAWEIVVGSGKPHDVEVESPDLGQQGTHPAVPIDDAERFGTRIDEFLNAARIKAGFSGAVIVARGGKPVYEGAFGFSRLKLKAPNTLDTPFRIASLSKQFTAAAIFRLEGQGKLNIDDPVHRYLAEFAEAPYRDITIHHLLTHTSGLPRSPESLMGSLRWNAMSQAATPVDDYVRLAVEMPLKFEPGTDYQYSNFGYRVLAALIARISGCDYADFMEQDVFQPLGMKDSGVARVNRPPSEARIAEGLTFRKLDRAGQPLFANGEDGRNFGAGYGSGGIYTSANDLLRWDRVLAGDEFLSESQKTRLFQPIHDNYACGWIVKKSGLDGRLYQMHNGANEGFFSQMMRIPEDDLVIIAVGNVDDTPALDEVLEQLFRLCRSLPYRDP